MMNDDAAPLASGRGLPGLEETAIRDSSSAPLLEVSGLEVRVRGRSEPLVSAVDFELYRGEIVGLVGASGSGKTLTACSLAGLLPAQLEAHGRVRLSGVGELLAGGEQSRQDGRHRNISHRRLGHRSRKIGMVFQDPMTALNPLLSIGYQLREAMPDLSSRKAKERGLELLEMVAMPDPLLRWRWHPHQLSGGQRQRVLIAMALAQRPELLIADEPTTALDVSVQAQVLDLLLELRQQLGLTILMITHDLAVVHALCDRVLVMAAGRLVEQASVVDLFAAPSHDATVDLLSCLPEFAAAGYGAR